MNENKVTNNGNDFLIVGIGASAGGLAAFVNFFEKMPHNTGMAFILVAHLSSKHATLMPEIIQKHTKMEVHLIRDGMNVEPNHIYINPPNNNIAISNRRLHLVELKGVDDGHVSIDYFLRTLAIDQGENAVSIIFSGMGMDGAQGSRAIKSECGATYAQDPKTTEYNSMPISAIETGIDEGR